MTASRDETARVWDSSNGQPLVTFKEHSGRVASVAFSPDGKHVASGSSDLKIWEAATGKIIRTIPQPAPSPFVSLAYSRDGQRLVGGLQDQTARIWDARTGKLLRTLVGHTSFVNAVDFSPGGQFVVSASGDPSWTSDHTVRLWSATGEDDDSLVLRGHNGPVNSVAFSADGSRIVTGSADNLAKVWNANTRKESCNLKGHSNSVGCAVFSLDGQRILTTSMDHTAKIWDAKSGAVLLTFQGHTNAVWAGAFSPDGQQVATAGVDHLLKLWDAATGRTLVSVDSGIGAIFSLAFHRMDGGSSLAAERRKPKCMTLPPARSSSPSRGTPTNCAREPAFLQMAAGSLLAIATIPSSSGTLPRAARCAHSADMGAPSGGSRFHPMDAVLRAAV